MNTYEAKPERRRERLEAAAAHARTESANRFNAASAAVDGIPSGQPILVDHYSAPRHRAALKRHDTNMRKAIDADKKAAKLATRAASVGTGGISSDDPDAIDKLADKRTDLERQRDHMKAVNAAFRKKDSAKLTDLTGKDYEAWVVAVAHNHSWDRQPFASYTLTNIGARIRQAAKRTTRIEAVQSLAQSTETIGGASVTIDPDDNRVTVTFPERLSHDDYKAMRSHGFLWSPTRNGFTRKISNGAVHYARQLAERIATA